MTNLIINSLLEVKIKVSTRRSLEKYPVVKKNAFNEARATETGAAIEGIK